MKSELSPILEFTDDFENNIDIAYEYFTNKIADPAHRPQLYDKEIFVECREKINDRPVGFWHIVSLEDTHNIKNYVPCVNDESNEYCNENCISGEYQIAIKYGSETRNLCLYRASRLPWIIDLIKMAERDDPMVDIWLKPGGNKGVDKLYLRYNHKGNDFLVVFTVEKKYYRLISAYPVFYNRSKKDLTVEYKKYKWSYFEK